MSEKLYKEQYKGFWINLTTEIVLGRTIYKYTISKNDYDYDPETGSWDTTEELAVSNAEKWIDTHLSIERNKAAITINALIDEHFNMNLVTCGSCGKIFNSRTNGDSIEQEGDIRCPYCDYLAEPCDFPDLFY